MGETFEYRWYLAGCRHLGWVALTAEEFEPKYDLLLRCDYVLRQYEKPRANAAFWRSLGGPVERLRILKMLRHVRRERLRFHALKKAVEAGMGLNSEEGGAGVPAYSEPKPPVRSEAAAKLLPPLDPEPAWRDP